MFFTWWLTFFSIYNVKFFTLYLINLALRGGLVDWVDLLEPAVGGLRVDFLDVEAPAPAGFFWVVKDAFCVEDEVNTGFFVVDFKIGFWEVKLGFLELEVFFWVVACSVEGTFDVNGKLGFLEEAVIEGFFEVDRVLDLILLVVFLEVDFGGSVAPFTSSMYKK